jgi:molecular chaperone DnaK (HSP70)
MTSPRPGDGGTWLVRPQPGLAQRLDTLDGIAFLGVDFGTSTTVVSLVVRDESGRSVAVRPLVLSQPSQHGGVVRDEIVNTVLAFRNDTLLFGRDAYNLRSRLTEGRNCFSSFKMGLGLDLGPEYGATALPSGRVPGITIERPADAAREFFKLLTRVVRDELDQIGLRRGARFAFSVPAAFQANQRRDLLAAIRGCGIEVDESCLIDEPNAAFLSYIHEAARAQDGQDLLVRAKAGKISVLVYDLGAGTCDVSILDFSISGERVTSRNRAISKFTALGGDDIDREIARRVLVAQLRQADGAPVELTSLDIEEKVVPALAPAAEKLKVTISKMMADQNVGRLDEARRLPDEVFETQAVPPFKLRGAVVGIETPTLSLHQFIEILGPFCGPRSGADDSRHLVGPVHDVLDKASLDPGEVDAVLFIGGSAQNPLIRAAVMDAFPPEVREVVPRNLRALVSQGAAIHSLGLHGFGFDFIAPITSEAISVVTRGNALETLIPASTPVPTEAPFVIELSIPEVGQRQLDVPICSGGRDRLVGIVSVKPVGAGGFARGDAVTVTGRLSKEKLLDVTVMVAGRTARAEILNPLSNAATSSAELAMLRERQRFNESMLRNNGRPEAAVVLAYSKAAAKAGEHELAADLLVALERITPGSDHATSICYHYSMAGRDRASHEWAAIAHRRKPTALTAHNLACGERDSAARERLLREALDRDPYYTSSAAMLAKMIEGRSPTEARQLREGIVAALEPEMRSPDMDLNDLRRLRDAARATGQEALANRATVEIERREREVATHDAPFHERNLAQGRGDGRLLARER